MPGPVPNHSDDLTRPRSRRNPDNVVTKGVRKAVTIPPGDPNWEPFVSEFYDSLKTSGQQDFYQDSDWHYARLVCAQIDAHMKGGMRSGQMFQSVMAALTSLLVTEGERRRVKIELTEPKPTGPTAGVTAMEEARARLMAPPAS